MAEAVVDLKEIAQRITLHVKLDHAREWRWRCKVGTFLIALAARIMWMGIEWVEDDD